jgi:hypothetical protein
MTNGNSDQNDRIERVVEGISLAVQANTEQINFLKDTLLELGQTVENQRTEYRGFMIKTDAILARIDATLASINAALERRDDGNGTSE